VPVGFATSFSITNCTRLLLNIRRACHTHTDQNPRPMTMEVEAGVPDGTLPLGKQTTGEGKGLLIDTNV